METEETSSNLSLHEHHWTLYDYSLYDSENKAFMVFTWIIISIEIPLLCLAIYTVFFLTKSGQGAPVFLINVLISDLIQTVSFVLTFFQSYAFIPLLMSFLVALYFMTCIAVERYLLIAHPIWYRDRHPVKCLVCTSLTGWLLSCFLFLFWPYPLFIMSLFYYLVIVFCFIGACRALSHSQSITSIKRRLVIATLLFVLLSYTFTILPFVIMALLLLYSYLPVYYFLRFTYIVYMFKPIVDCLLYVFMRTDAGDAFRTPHCCCRRREIQSETQLANLTGVNSGDV